MIQLNLSASDNVCFLELGRRIVNGAVASFGVPEVYLVHIDNWFDHKWLGWWSNWEHKEPKTLYVPPFNPNRILAQHHYIWDPKNLRWDPAGQGRILHRRAPGRVAQSRQKLDEVASSAAFVWYSGNTLANQAGSIMLYLSGTEAYAWYASFVNEGGWKVNDEFHITRNQLASFEKRGRWLESRQEFS